MVHQPMLKETLHSKWFTASAFIVIVFFLISIIKLMPQLATISGELKNLNYKIVVAKKADSELQKMSDYLKSDSYLERQARIRLNYKKPDENVVFVYPNPNRKAQSISGGSTKSRFLLSRLFGWFMGLTKK